MRIIVMHYLSVRSPHVVASSAMSDQNHFLRQVANLLQNLHVLLRNLPIRNDGQHWRKDRSLLRDTNLRGSTRQRTRRRETKSWTVDADDRRELGHLPISTYKPTTKASVSFNQWPTSSATFSQSKDVSPTPPSKITATSPAPLFCMWIVMGLPSSPEILTIFPGAGIGLSDFIVSMTYPLDAMSPTMRAPPCKEIVPSVYAIGTADTQAATYAKDELGDLAQLMENHFLRHAGSWWAVRLRRERPRLDRLALGRPCKAQRPQPTQRAHHSLLLQHLGLWVMQWKLVIGSIPVCSVSNVETEPVEPPENAGGEVVSARERSSSSLVAQQRGDCLRHHATRHPSLSAAAALEL